MKYGLGIRMLIAFLVGALAVLYKAKTPAYRESELTVAINAPRRFTFETLTNPRNVPKYFSWITHLEESKFDRRNISLGKVYRGVVNLPWLGQHEIQYRVTEINGQNWVVLRPDRLKESWFNTEITMSFFKLTKDETYFGIKIVYRKTSALFQMTLGRYLRFITEQQVDRISVAAKNLVHQEWERFRFPHGRSKAFASAKSKNINPLSGMSPKNNHSTKSDDPNKRKHEKK